ncbi:hypothetical protein, partial [Kluyvera georgiana]|uniref:hypothetical protein n=1 Tax=Kluyvera georgiana TaxID=73098 RepID=UPI001ADF62DA
MLLFYTVIIIQVTARYNRTFLEGTADTGQYNGIVAYSGRWPIEHRRQYVTSITIFATLRHSFVTEGIKKAAL